MDGLDNFVTYKQIFIWIERKEGKKILPIEFCDDSTSQVTGGLSKQLNTNDEEDGIEWNLKQGFDYNIDKLEKRFFVQFSLFFAD